MKKSLLLINLLFLSMFSIAQSGSETYDGCEGDGYSVDVNGTTYDEANPSGTETITGGAADGTDTTIVIDLTFNPTYSETESYDGCEGDGYQVTVNGTIYDENNPTGTENLLTVDGCDSIVTIDLVYKSSGTNLVTYTGCTGDGYQVTVNGNIYDETTPSGVETISGGAANGCDSIITVDLDFTDPTSTVTYNGCEGDGYSVVVNGNTYDETTPTGTETITGGSVNGCDSTITVDLTYNPAVTSIESYTGCEGDGYSVVVNGNTYDEATPNGTENLQTVNGCDSTVTIDLEFLPNSTGTESYDGCSGDGYSVTVNGTTYDESNASGTETLTAANGCDSIVTIDLVYKSPGTNLITYTGCTGDGYQVTINSIVYDETNPTGTETIAGGAANGCDSIITVDLDYTNPSSTETYTGCEGDGYQVTVNGTTYDELNPTGTETLIGASVNGCDSTITVNLTFIPASTGTETYTGCEGDGYQVTVNGNTYDEGNPTGLETIAGGAANGCDSIVTVDLTFDTAITGVDEIVACESYTWIDGVEYTASNNTATQTLTSVGGCDSIVTLDLTITPTLNITVDEVVNSSNDIVLIAQQSGATYQWLDCNDNSAPITGANNQTFIASANGSYAVVISKGGCVDTSSCVNITDASVSEFSEFDDKLSIHPNPSEGVFNVSGYTKGTSNIIVMDALGRQIVDAVVTKTSTSIDLSSKQSGVYFFSIIQDGERSLRKVILK